MQKKRLAKGIHTVEGFRNRGNPSESFLGRGDTLQTSMASSPSPRQGKALVEQRLLFSSLHFSLFSHFLSSSSFRHRRAPFVDLFLLPSFFLSSPSSACGIRSRKKGGWGRKEPLPLSPPSASASLLHHSLRRGESGERGGLRGRKQGIWKGEKKRRRRVRSA